MRRRVVCGVAVAGVGFALVGALILATPGGRSEATSLIPTSSPTPAPQVLAALDCDVAMLGVQGNCTLAPGASSVEVGVVIVNNSGASYALGSFDLWVHDPDVGRLIPPTISTGLVTDRNPDLNEADLSAAWQCALPSADTGADGPGSAVSYLSCSEGGPPAVVPSGGSVTVAFVRYNVPAAATAGQVSLVLDMDFADSAAIPGGCAITLTNPCVGATISIVSAPSGPPSPTATAAATATSTPSPTPVVVSEPPPATPTADIYFAIDCDLTHPGVQSDCTYRLGQVSEIDVGFVLVNNGPPPPSPLAAFNFAIHMPDRTRLAPLPSLSALDGNPDFNEAAISGLWACFPASDLGIDGPGAAVSFLSCIELGTGGFGPLLPSGSQLLLGTVRYNVLASAEPGSVILGVDNVAAANHETVQFADCYPGGGTAALCLPATVNLVAFPAVAKVPAGVGSNVDVSVPAANLWVCQMGPCAGPGEGDLEVIEHATGVFTGDQNGDSVADGLGAYEFQVEFDSFVIQSLNPLDVVFAPGGAGAARGPATCTFSIVFENSVRFGCVTSGQAPGPEGNFDLAKLDLIPAADDVKDLFPGNDNGIPTLLKDNQCELADVFGHPVQGTVGGAGQIPLCGDLFVTVRILEGDMNLDCMVDVADEAMIAQHFGAFFGSALYQKWFDLEPRFHDLDIDIKDVQKVFGRDGSTCQSPVPAQTPVAPPSGFGG